MSPKKIIQQVVKGEAASQVKTPTKVKERKTEVQESRVYLYCPCASGKTEHAETEPNVWICKACGEKFSE